jgi:hypothetical protein
MRLLMAAFTMDRALPLLLLLLLPPLLPLLLLLLLPRTSYRSTLRPS